MKSQNEEKVTKRKMRSSGYICLGIHANQYTQSMTRPRLCESLCPLKPFLVQLEEDELGDTRAKILNLDALPDLTAPDEDTITLPKDSLVIAACDLEYRSLLASSVGLFCIVTGSLDELNVDSLLVLAR